MNIDKWSKWISEFPELSALWNKLPLIPKKLFEIQIENFVKEQVAKNLTPVSENSALDRLFQHLDKEHGIILLDTEKNDIKHLLLGEKEYLKQANDSGGGKLPDKSYAEKEKSFYCESYAFSGNYCERQCKDCMYENP